ncbi:MAG: CehA/McbA family metallohydrolase [Halobacteria archaeon]|nr:CehA/McbA family metallohydrolase [Candidatus Bathyarchaeota archaeon]
MVVNIDLHIHTSFSGDSTVTPKILIEKLNAHPLITGIALTDHDTVRGYEVIRKLAEPYSGIIIIPGIEVTTLQGHLIILGINEKPRLPLTVWEAVDYGKSVGGIVIIPHPYRAYSGLCDFAKSIIADAIEVINPNASDHENRRALKLSKDLNLPATAGSDCHNPNQMWKAYTEIDANQNIDDILKAIKNRKIRPCKLG